VAGCPARWGVPCSWRAPALGIGGTITVTCSGTVSLVTAPGPFFVGVVADAGNAVVESNEANNTSSVGCTAGVSGKPNIVVVMTDDLDFASLNLLLDNGMLPNIKARLLDHGTRFNESFVGNSLCCPSRATFLTGQYSHNNRTRTNNNGFGQFTPHQNDTLGTHLKAAGYRTAYFGKYLNGYTDAAYHAPGWDEWQALLEPTVYYMYGFKLVKSINGAAATTVTYNGGSTATAATNYQTDVLAGLGSTFIATATTPFLLVTMTLAPHVEVLPGQTFNTYTTQRQLRVRPAPRHYGLLRAKLSSGAVDDFTPISATYDLPHKALPSFNEADVTDKPGWLQNGPTGGGGWPVLTASNLRDATRGHLDRLEAMLGVDDLVGTTYAALDARGVTNNTVVVFSSDNGFMLSEHRLYNKMFPYEESIRVPLIASCGPTAPAVETHYAGNIDLSPTFADYAGASSGWTNMDGRSLRPLLEGSPVPAWRKRLLVEHWFDPNGPIFNDLWDFAQVRTSGDDALPNQSYVEYYGTSGTLNQSSVATARELYDVPVDPSEEQAVTTSAAYAAERTALGTRLQALRLCAGATCRAAEDAP